MRTTYQKSYWAFLFLICFSSCLGTGGRSLSLEEETKLMEFIQEGRTTEAGEEVKKEKYSAEQLGEALVQTARVIFNSGLIETLLEQEGIDVNYQDKNGETALIAAFSGPLKCTKSIAPLQIGKEKKTAIAKLLIEGGADINIQNNLGHTASTLAITYNMDKFLKWGLKEGKIAPNFQTKNPRLDKKLVAKSTLLMSAARQGKLAIIKLLLSCKADPGLQDDLGRTALMILMAQKWNIKGAAELLINAMTPKQLACRDKNSKTAVFYFLNRKFQKGDKEVAKLLIDKMKRNNLFKVDREHRSAFHDLLDKGEHTVEDIAIAQLFIDQMSPQDASTYHKYALKPSRQSVFSFQLKSRKKNNSHRTRSGSAASTLLRSSKPKVKFRKNRKSAGRTQEIRPRVGSVFSILSRSAKTPSALIPRDHIVVALAKAMRGSLIIE